MLSAKTVKVIMFIISKCNDLGVMGYVVVDCVVGERPTGIIYVHV